MIIFLCLIFSVAIGFVIFKYLSRRWAVPDRKVIDRTNTVSSSNSSLSMRLRILYIDIIDKLSRKVFISGAAREDLAIKISRLGMNTTPEKIRAEQVIYVGVTLCFSLLGFLIFPLIGIISLIFVLMSWFFPLDEMDKEIKKRNEEILKDFPTFFNMNYYAYKNSNDTPVREVILDFLPNASPAFENELNRFLDDEKEGEKNAIRNLRRRVPLSYIIRYCDLIEQRVVEGRDNVNAMFHFKMELQQVRLNELEDTLNKKVIIANTVQDLILIPMFLLFIIHFGMQLLSITKLFRG